MDPVKVVIFIAAFLLLLFLGRKLSSNSESIVVPAPISTDGPVEEDEKQARQPAIIGAELPFPISLPDLVRDPDGRYNRPEFHNYYFEKTDLLSGPADPATFYDYFFLEARDVEKILETVIAHIIKFYSEEFDKEGNALPDPDSWE